MTDNVNLNTTSPLVASVALCVRCETKREKLEEKIKGYKKDR
jgi:hypothetical protein